MDSTLRKIIGLGALVAALAFPAVAVAEPFDAEAEADYAAALEYWGQQPTGCSSVERELVTELPFGATDAAGEATQTEPGEPPVPCGVWIRAGLLPCEEKSVMYHEVGHILAHGHSTDPDSIMNPEAKPVFCEREAVGGELRVLAHQLHHAQTHCRAHCRPWIGELRTALRDTRYALAVIARIIREP